ncbi:MAG: O-antigen ligase family protein [Acidiferrobacterales bacterium]
MLILAVFAAVLAIVAVFSPVHALGMWLTILIVHGMLVDLFGPIATHLPMVAGIAITAVILLRRQWTGVKFGTLMLFVVLVAIMAIAGIVGMHPARSQDFVLLYGKGFLLSLLLAGCIKDEADIKVMTVYCLFGLVTGVMMGFYQKITGHYAISDIYVQRIATLSGDPNNTAMLFVSGVPLSVYWYMNHRQMTVRLLSVACLVLILIGTVLTSSRGGLVTLIMVLLAVFLRRPSVKIALVFVLGTLVALPLAPLGFWTRINSLVTGHEHHGGHSLKNRLMLLTHGTGILLKHPLLGVGPGNFGCALIDSLGGTLQATDFGGSCGSAAHNLFLQFFVENGVPAGILLLIAFYLAMRGGLKYDRMRGGRHNPYGLGFAIVLSLSALLFAGMFLSVGKNAVLWFMTGLGLAMGVIVTDAQRNRLAVARGRGTRRILPARKQPASSKVSLGEDSHGA